MDRRAHLVFPPCNNINIDDNISPYSVAKSAPLRSKHPGFARGGCALFMERESSTNLVALILRYETERWALRAVMTEMNDTMKEECVMGKLQFSLFYLFCSFFHFHLCMMA